MNGSLSPNHPARQLHCGLVLRVREDTCDVLREGHLRAVRYAPPFLSPRTERLSPGHLAAITTASEGLETMLWRWYDAVVIGEEEDAVTIWEPAHGEVLAEPRPAYRRGRIGTRAYASAGLPGADWWVAGPVVSDGQHADVDLPEVERLYTEHGLWSSLQ